VVSDAIGRRVGTLEELMSLSNQELYKITSKVGIFSRALSYITEAYYVAGLALESLAKDYPEGFKIDAYNKKMQEIHESKRKLGRLIRYNESYSVPLTKSALKYYTHLDWVKNQAGMIQISNEEEFTGIVNKLKKNLEDQLTVNIRVVDS
jgi:glycerol-3-phosphate O-acyltransferase